VAHRPLAAEDDGTQALFLGDSAGVLDELAHLLVDVGRDDDGLVGVPGVLQGRDERRQRLPGAAGPSKSTSRPSVSASWMVAIASRWWSYGSS